MTTLEAEDILYPYLNGSSLKIAVASREGKVYKNSRPIGDKKEAVVIQAVTVNNLALSEGLINVNVYVPNKVIDTGAGIQDDSIADHARLKELAILGHSLLKDVFIPNSDIGFEIMNQLIFSDEVAKEHYVNFRVRVYSINLN